jgi:hypothetical protein
VTPSLEEVAVLADVTGKPLTTASCGHGSIQEPMPGYQDSTLFFLSFLSYNMMTLNSLISIKSTKFAVLFMYWTGPSSVVVLGRHKPPEKKNKFCFLKLQVRILELSPTSLAWVMYLSPDQSQGLNLTKPGSHGLHIELVSGGTVGPPKKQDANPR